MLHVETIVSVPFEQNTLVIWRDGAAECLVVDPGMQPGKIAEMIESNDLTPAAMLLTHGHSDHIFGVTAIKERWPECPVVIGRGDAYKLTDPEGNLSAQFGLPFATPPADRLVDEGDTLEYAGLTFDVLETPGHSPGHVVFLFRDGDQLHVINGDVLFRGGVGRSDFFDGDPMALVESITKKLFPLDDDAIVYTGHGPHTTIGHERQHNPFVGAAARGE